MAAGVGRRTPARTLLLVDHHQLGGRTINKDVTRRKIHFKNLPIELIFNLHLMRLHSLLMELLLTKMWTVDLFFTLAPNSWTD